MDERDARIETVMRPPMREIVGRLSAYIIPCVVALFVFDTLYRLDSLVKAMTLHDLLVTVSAMFLILLGVGVGAVLAGTALTLLAWPARRMLLAAVRLLALIFIALITARAVLHWLLKVGEWETWAIGQWATSVIGVRVPSALVLTFYYVAVAAGVGIWLVRTRRTKSVLAAFEAAARDLAKVMPLVALLPLAIIGHHLFVTAGKREAPVCSSEPIAKDPAAAMTLPVKGALPNIVLVTFDALTAQDMSLYGYRLPTTPVMERLAQESHVYEQASSVSNWTRPGTVSMLTGQYPHHHRLVSTLSDAMILPDPTRTLPQQLRSMGYRTAAIVSNASFGHPLVNGTYRSFDTCTWEAFSPGFLNGNVFRRLRHDVRNKFGILLLEHDIHVTGWMDDLLNSFAAFRFWQRHVLWNEKSFAPPERTFDLARQAISQADGRPGFFWVHVFPPHAPYLPDHRYRGRFLPQDDLHTISSQDRIPGLYAKDRQAEVDRLRLRYDEYILNADQALGEFIDFLKKSGRWENTLLVVSADHGESFTKGIYGHRGEYLYQSMTHIPLLLHLPGQRTGTRIGGAVSQTDIAPTILHYLKAPVPPWMDGKPLRTDAAAPVAEPYRYSMEIERNGIGTPLRQGIVAAHDGKYKLIYSLTHDTIELFDLQTDPDESTNVAQQNPAVVARMRAAILNEFKN